MDPLAALEHAVAAAPSAVAKVRSLNALAQELARAGNADRAYATAREAGALAGRGDDRQLVAETRNTLGSCHFYVGDFMRALEHFLEAAQLYQDAGDTAGTATAFVSIGMCQHRLGANDDAVASMLRGLEAARAQRLESLEVNIYNALGSALIAARRDTDAAAYLATGVARARETGNRTQLTKLLLNQSLLDKQRGDAARPQDEAAAQAHYAHALAQATQALEIAREIENPYDEAYCLGQTGTVLRLMGNTGEAEAILESALDLGRRLQDPQLQAQALVERGTTLAAQGRGADAQRSLTEAVVLARRIGAGTVLAEACEALSRLFEQAGDFQRALALYKEFHAVREAELANSRQHAATAAQLWIDFQEAAKRASEYRARAESLAADHAALTRKAKVLTEESERDPLTGLLNRRGLDARIAALLAASDASELPLAVALIDVDHFKRINDNFSHTVGDQVLRRVATTIRAHCRQDDLPVRYGGDEFLVVLSAADAERGERVLARFKRASDACAWHDEAPGLRVTLSIGVACRAPGTTFAAAVATADEALYAAKAAGRNRISASAAKGIRGNGG
ncbi:MAG: tetratricopeptide repeat-containing diguanylate cyclase [Burkholderiales bacterium]